MSSPVSFGSGNGGFGLSSLYSNNALPQSITGTLNALLNAGNGTSGASSANNSTQVEISGLGQLLSALTSFQDTMQTLEPPIGVFNSTASNSNPAVLSATATAVANPASYNVVVNSLAQSQTLESTAVANENSTSIGTGSLTIKAGTYNSVANTFTPSGAPAANVTINTGTLSDIANSINAANAGVFASIEQDSAGYHLVLTNSTTGTANNFEVLVNDSDGNNTDTSGLSQIAYDPTASVGAGQNLTQAQAAANASYTVNGVNASSASNALITIGPGVAVSLMQTGSTTLNVSADPTAASNVAQTLVSAYNTLQSAINNLQASNAAAANDPVVGGLTQALASQTQTSFNNGASQLTTLGQIGINYQFPSISLLESTNFAGGGTLSLSSTSFNSAFSNDPTGTESLLNLAAQGFDSLSSAYGVPGGSISDLVNELQQINSYNQLLSQTQPSDTPSTSELLNVEQRDGITGFSAQQISSEQQYAQAYSLIAPYSLEATIVGILSNGLGSSGNLLSTFA